MGYLGYNKYLAIEGEKFFFKKWSILFIYIVTFSFFLNFTLITVDRSVVSMAFYGLALNTGSLGGDFYLNFFLQGIVEIPAYIICQSLLNVIGRRILHCSTMILGGTCCICTIFTMLYADKCKFNKL